MADWGLPHGGPRAYPGWRGAGYGRARDNSGRGGSERWAGNGNYNRNGGGDQRSNFGGEQRGGLDNNQRGNWNGQQNSNQRGFGLDNRGSAQSVSLTARSVAMDSTAASSLTHPIELTHPIAAYQQPAYSYTHPAGPAQQTYNRAATQPAYAYRPQTSVNSGYGVTAIPQTAIPCTAFADLCEPCTGAIVPQRSIRVWLRQSIDIWLRGIRLLRAVERCPS